MPSAEFSSTVASRLFTASPAIRREAVFGNAYAQDNNLLASIRHADDASVHTMDALEAIAESNLTGEQKDALIKLTAQIDEREGGSPAFLDDIETLVGLLNSGADASQSEPMSLEQAQARYGEERDFLSAHDDINVAFSLSFNQVESQFVNPDSKAEQDFLRAATNEDMMRAFALAKEVLGLGADLFA